MKKNYSEQQLLNAMAEGKTISGAARVLGCSRGTFKRYWKELQLGDIRPTTHSGYIDQTVEGIVNRHRTDKTENESYAIIIEITDRIDSDEKKINALKAEIARFEDYLKNMEL